MPTIIKSGFVVSRGQHINDVISYRTEDENGQDYPLIFDTEREAQLEIIDTIEEHIRQFKDGEREFYQIDLEQEEFVARIDITDDGNMIVEGITYNIQEWINQL